MVRVLVLTNNVTLIGEIENELSNDYTRIKQPIQLGLIPSSDHNNRTTIAFIPYLEYTKEFSGGIDIPKSKILCVATPVEDLENKYISAFSRLTLPEGTTGRAIVRP